MKRSIFKMLWHDPLLSGNFAHFIKSAIIPKEIKKI